MSFCSSLSVGIHARGFHSSRRVRAVPDESSPAPVSDTHVVSPEPYGKTTFSTSPSIRSHPLDLKPKVPGRQGIQQQEWMLGAAALVTLAGIAAWVSQRPRPPPRALPAASSVTGEADPSLLLPADSAHHQATPSAAPDGQQLANWWEQRQIFIVADQGDGQDPATAGPILFQAAGRAIMPSFQDKKSAEKFAAALRAWNRVGDGAFGHSTAQHTGQFHVVVLTPADLHLGNVPDMILVPETLVTRESLASSDSWREAVQSIAAPQLQAWQEHVVAAAPPAAAPDAAPAAEPPAAMPGTPAREATAAAPPAAPQTRDHHSEDSEALPSAPPQHAQHAQQPAETQSTAGGQLAEGSPAAVPLGPPLPPSMTAATANGAADQQGTLDSESQLSNGSSNGGSACAPPTVLRTAEAPTSSHAAAAAQHAQQPSAAGPPPPPAATDGDAAVGGSDEQPARPRSEAETPPGPKVYASVADLEADTPWDMTASNGGNGDAAAPQEELRLLSEEETDASVVHPDAASLKVVFTPILMRRGGGGEEEEGRLMFTVDATLDEGDPDVVALAFEDPVDANAMLSMLAHVCGFTDADGVVRRVVPMPPGAAAEAAEGQGASLLCMAQGFQAKANVRAGRDINGVLSRIAGARWASLIQQQQAAFH
eukprot:jgi/Ulvmu1/2206/UM013_0052.1